MRQCMGKLASSMIHDGKCMTDLKPLFFFLFRRYLHAEYEKLLGRME